MDLDPAFTGQSYDPDKPGAGVEQLADLDLQVQVVLAAVGIFDGERRRTVDPARLLGHVADGDAGRAQGVVDRR